MSTSETMTVLVNGEPKQVPLGCTLERLVEHLGLRSTHVATEVNRQLVPLAQRQEHPLHNDDAVEVVHFVGGGAPRSNPCTPESYRIPRLRIGKHRLQSRLMVGTGKYASFDQMRDCLAASGAEVVTVAVRRERLIDSEGRNLLDYIDLERFTILPNTAGCFDAEQALRTANLGRELLSNLENPGADWVKLEVLSDPKTLLPDPLATLEACQVLVDQGFTVLCYTSDDPVMARRLKVAGAACVMPAGSPIGSGQGVLNPNNIRIILEDLKGDDSEYPVVIDAGVGTASDVTIAMELGCDGVLLNTGIASADDPLAMAHAMRLALDAGYLAARSGRIPRKLYAQASSPDQGLIGGIGPVDQNSHPDRF